MMRFSDGWAADDAFEHLPAALVDLIRELQPHNPTIDAGYLTWCAGPVIIKLLDFDEVFASKFRFRMSGLIRNGEYSVMDARTKMELEVMFREYLVHYI